MVDDPFDQLDSEEQETPQQLNVVDDADLQKLIREPTAAFLNHVRAIPLLSRKGELETTNHLQRLRGEIEKQIILEPEFQLYASLLLNKRLKKNDGNSEFFNAFENLEGKAQREKIVIDFSENVVKAMGTEPHGKLSLFFQTYSLRKGIRLQFAVGMRGQDDWSLFAEKPIAKKLIQFIEFRTKLIASNFRLVVSIAKGYESAGLTFGDMIQEGNLGLMRAVDTFQVGRGKRFSSHASWYIRTSIVRAIQDKGRVIHLPPDIQKNLQRLEEAKNKFRVQYGFEPQVVQLADDLSISAEEVEELLRLAVPIVSFDTPMDDEEGGTLLDRMEDREHISPSSGIHYGRLRNLLLDIVDNLQEREAELITLRFGLKDGKQATYEDLARTHGVSRDRIRKIEKAAINRIRKSPHYELLKQYLSFLEN